MATRRESSGDILADRRLEYGKSLAAEGDHAAAADLFTQALERVPNWAAGWFALGEARIRLGAQQDAVAAFSKTAALDPEGRLGALLALAALGTSAVPDGADPAHVRALFDDYAPRFEAHLTQALGYRAPELLMAALSRSAPDRRWQRTFDLGCGTGLMGDAIRPTTDWLGGVDLSPDMVERARDKNIYDQLAVGEMIFALKAEPVPLDLVLAADVFVYVGDLRPVFAATAAVMKPNGLFAFTLQRGPYDSDVRVGPDRRFTHSPDHLRTRAAEAGFEIVSQNEAATRRDGGSDVPGLVVVLSK